MFAFPRPLESSSLGRDRHVATIRHCRPGIPWPSVLFLTIVREQRVTIVRAREMLRRVSCSSSRILTQVGETATGIWHIGLRPFPCRRPKPRPLTLRGRHCFRADKCRMATQHTILFLGKPASRSPLGREACKASSFRSPNRPQHMPRASECQEPISANFLPLER